MKGQRWKVERMDNLEWSEGKLKWLRFSSVLALLLISCTSISPLEHFRTDY